MSSAGGPYNYYIYFFGLICHMGDDKLDKHFAAMVKDDEHDPVAYFYDPISTKATDPYPIDYSDGVKFSMPDFDPERPVFTVADARTTSEFRRFVPSLQDLMGGHPRLNINEFALPVYYPASDDNQKCPLTVADFYKDEGYYLRNGNRVWGPSGPDCVASLTQLTLTTKYETVWLVNVKKNEPPAKIGIPLTPAYPCVIIANLACNHNPGHLTKYGNILIDEDSNVTILRGKCELYSDDSCRANCDWVCDWLADQIRAGNDLECGNTNWP